LPGCTKASNGTNKKDNNEMALSIAVQQEIRAAQQEAEGISTKPAAQLTPQDKRRFDFLMSQISLLKSGALSDETRYASADALAEEFGFKKTDRTEQVRSQRAGLESFRAYMSHGEFRTYAGLNSVVGANGGFLLPVEFERILLQGMAQYDDLLNPDNVRVIPTQNGRTLSLPSLDLSTITSTQVAQNTQQLPVANPTVASNTFGGYSFKTNPIAVTMEAEMDFFESAMKILMVAFGTGLARGIGQALVTGTGSSQPSGLLTVAQDSTIVSAGSAFTHDELLATYMSVNRAYRSSPKAAFVMNDAIYQNILALKDTTGRPLINTTEDGEKLFGKRVLIAPSMPTAAGSRALVFGDLSQFAVRIVGSPEVKRAQEISGYVEKGLALYTAWLRVDSGIIAPGSVAPLVFSTLHS
jgi:HK97 family phage major capsid protein